MRLVKESLSQIVECDKQQLVESCTPSLEVVEAKVADLNPYLDCEVQAQIALKLRDMVRCAVQCAAEEFGVASVDAARWLDWVVEDLKIRGCPDDCVAQIFAVPEEEVPDSIRKDMQDLEESDFSTNLMESDEYSAPADPEKYWRVVYRHPTGIYATRVVRGLDHYHAESVLRATYQPRSWSFEPISKDKFEDLLEQGVPELNYKGKVVAVQGDDYSIVPEEEVPDSIRKDMQDLEESLERDITEEALNVNVDTDQQNINVAKEDSSVDIKIDSKDCDNVECDAEAELQELARDPKYTKALAYLMRTLQPAEGGVEEVDSQESLTESNSVPPTEDPEVDGSAEELELETDPPKGEGSAYMASMLGTLVKEEYDAVASYTSFLQDLEANDLGDDSDRKVICDILAEENVHIGQLQELLKKVAPTAENIEVGAEEAKAQIEAAEEDGADEN